MDVKNLINEVRNCPALYDQTDDEYRNFEYKEFIWKSIATKLDAKGGVEECKTKWTSVRDQLRKTIQRRKASSGARNRKYIYEDMLQFLIPHLVERDPPSSFLLAIDQQEDYEELKFPFNDESTAQIQDSHEDFCQQTLSIDHETEIKFRSPRSSPTSISTPFVNKHTFAWQASKRKSPYDLKPPSMVYTKVPNKRRLETKRSHMEDEDSGLHPVDAFLRGIAPTLKSLSPVLLNQAKSSIFCTVQEIEMKQLMSLNNPENLNLPNYSELSPSSSSQSIPTQYPMPIKVEIGNEYDSSYYSTDN